MRGRGHQRPPRGPELAAGGKGRRLHTGLCQQEVSPGLPNQTSARPQDRTWVGSDPEDGHLPGWSPRPGSGVGHVPGRRAVPSTQRQFSAQRWGRGLGASQPLPLGGLGTARWSPGFISISFAWPFIESQHSQTLRSPFLPWRKGPGLGPLPSRPPYRPPQRERQ